MSKMGRPTDSPKNTRLNVRVDEETIEKLDYCSKIQKVSRSEIVRRGVSRIYDETKK